MCMGWQWSDGRMSWELLFFLPGYLRGTSYCFIHCNLEQHRGMAWYGQCQLKEYFLEGKKGEREWNTEKERERAGKREKVSKKWAAGRQARIEICLPMITRWWNVTPEFAFSWITPALNEESRTQTQEQRRKQLGEVSGGAERKLLTWHGVLLTRGLLHPFPHQVFLEGRWGLFKLLCVEETQRGVQRFSLHWVP